ncbi:MAG: fibronectin type III domain-containing protein [Candidatus Marinimicrobia bacterium]|nr:fibronectin type III domain-containing protein [Candidatus Neomarinimicrobiota bacterium]
MQAQVLNDSQIKLTWSQKETRISGFKISRNSGGVDYSQITELAANISDFTDSGLKFGSTYTYRINAFADENLSGDATSNPTNTSFPSPTDLMATPIDDQSIQLTWQDNCNFEKGYRVERSSDSTNFSQIAELGENITEFKDTILKYGPTYTYRIKAFTNENESGYVTVEGTNTIFPEPTNLTATGIDDQSIRLTWSDNCSFEKGYRIEQSDDGTPFSQVAELDEDITEYIATELKFGTTYTYRIRAFTDGNNSGYATSTATNTIFPPPSNLTATPIDDQSIQLTWSDNCSFESGYRIERSVDGSNFSQIAELGENSSEYTDPGLTLGNDYTYRVKAYTKFNESAYSKEELVNFLKDCLGVWNGSAVIDCNGDCDGSAIINICSICVGGNTGIDENYCETVTDIDGNDYKTVKIGGQAWMAENLKVTKYRDGSAIPKVHSNSDWSNLTTGAYAVYNDDDGNANTYGYLYNWYAITDNRIIAPTGWHVPTDDEWTTLIGFLGNDPGGKLKETGTAHWNSPNTGATNESGFTAIPGGSRASSIYSSSGGYFSSVGSQGLYWSSTKCSSCNNNRDALSLILLHDRANALRYSGSMSGGKSVRLIRD